MDDLFRYASELERLGEHDRALDEYADLLEEGLGGMEPLVRRARLQRRLGRIAEADADMARAEIEDLFRRASELELLGKTEDAIAEYTDLLNAGRGGIEPLLRRADLQRRLGRTAEATAGFTTAAAASQENGWPLLRLAQLAAETGRPWLAARHAEEALKRQPDPTEIRIHAATLFGALDWFDRALDAVRTLPEDLPAPWEYVRKQAAASYTAHRTAALARLRQRGRCDPILDAWELSLALFRVGRVELASRLCEIVMRDRPRSFAAFELYTKIVARQRGAAAALAFLQSVRFLHDGDPDRDRMMTLMRENSDG